MKRKAIIITAGLFIIYAISSLINAQTFDKYKNAQQKKLAELKIKSEQEIEKLRVEYKDFVEKQNKEFAAYIEKEWEAFSSFKGIEPPDIPKPDQRPVFDKTRENPEIDRNPDCGHQS